MSHLRIGTVTAHYPPNFVSGGTLVPQRITEGLRARGHEMDVFAGSYQDGSPDLTIRHEVTDTGVRIQWTTVTGMLGWADEVNYHNDRMAAEFTGWLERVRPDVVHFHNLQGFGGSLVSIAAASGAVTVVTTHDMWWWCARQFLVDRDMRPCSIVVDCGVCPCERDNAWLAARNRELAGHLRTADLVLAPSASMIELLSANGVSPDRLALDENPAPESIVTAAAAPPRRTGSDGTVRFVFAGGNHAVKGGRLAVAAAAELADLPGWSLDLYGVTEPDDLPPPVRRQPPYDPDTVAEVLSRYDVLVMSSIMLESYSLLTREALAAGCVVITGDNPGPTEVVQDGRNGLIVPRGDAAALGRAMARLVVEPGLLDRLRPEPGALRLRSLDDQLDGLLGHYRTLLAARSRSARTHRPIRTVLIVSGITGAPLRYRGYFPQEALESVGVHADLLMYRDPDVLAKARTADAVVLYRVPATEQILDVVRMVRGRPEPVPVLFDVDDLIFDPELRHELDPVLTKVPGLDLDLYWQGIRRYRTTLQAADAYIGSTAVLCARVTELTGIPSYRFANGVGRELARISDFELYRARKPGPVRIGYFSGTNTHNDDWAFVEPAIVAVLTARPQVQLWIGGLLEVSDALAPFADRITRLPLKPWYRLPTALRDLDVNLAPLEPGKVFNDAKSAIKWLEAALTRTPTVASPSEPFREAIDDGRTGLLAGSLEEWTTAVLRLIDDPALRESIGHAAREQVLRTLSPARQGHRYLRVLESARDGIARDGHPPLFADWTPEMLSEPFIPQRIDGYGPPPQSLVVGGGVRSVLRQWADRNGATAALYRLAAGYRRAGVDLLRTHGPVGAVRAAGSRGLRVTRSQVARVTRRGR